ncbi:hypothetical protein NUW54_g2184 [Trametes sanguinea]|uniref:Uncharacterized protein n=1 Tax=Trametes sanguinea TaxID=158606 RepID=A0ACC1Q757_9APHY|nr:hypothetical protein NUW54_g2184 [Trametes sanguinea]
MMKMRSERYLENGERERRMERSGYSQLAVAHTELISVPQPCKMTFDQGKRSKSKSLEEVRTGIKPRCIRCRGRILLPTHLASHLLPNPCTPSSTMQQIQVDIHNPTLEEVLCGLQWGSYMGTKAVQSTNQKGVSDMEKRLFHSFQKVVVQHPIPILSNSPSLAEQSWMNLRDPQGFAMLRSGWASASGNYVYLCGNAPSNLTHLAPPHWWGSPRTRGAGDQSHPLRHPPKAGAARCHHASPGHPGSGTVSPAIMGISFLAVEMKTERALLNKTPRMEQIVGSQGGRLANRSNAEKLLKADRMLLQVWVQLTTSASPAGILMDSNTVYYVEAQAGILYMDGPYYLPHSSPAHRCPFSAPRCLPPDAPFIHGARGEGAPESCMIGYRFL